MYPGIPCNHNHRAQTIRKNNSGISGTKQKGLVIYNGDLTPEDAQFKAVNFRNWTKLIPIAS